MYINIAEVFSHVLPLSCRCTIPKRIPSLLWSSYVHNTFVCRLWRIYIMCPWTFIGFFFLLIIYVFILPLCAHINRFLLFLLCTHILAFIALPLLFTSRNYTSLTHFLYLIYLWFALYVNVCIQKCIECLIVKLISNTMSQMISHLYIFVCIHNFVSLCIISHANLAVNLPCNFPYILANTKSKTFTFIVDLVLLFNFSKCFNLFIVQLLYSNLFIYFSSGYAFIQNFTKNSKCGIFINFDNFENLIFVFFHIFYIHHIFWLFQITS